MSTERKNMGRQKIEMAKMTSKSNLLVTFSKRQSGLLKKASEICTLCDAEVAVVVFSPGKKVSSFGHPNVKAVIDRFFTEESMEANPEESTSLNETHQNPSVPELNMQLTQLLEKLEQEKKRNKKLRQLKEVNSQIKQYWWERPVEELDEAQLEKLKSALEDIKVNAEIESFKFLNEGSSSNSSVDSHVSMP